MYISSQERILCELLQDLPRRFGNRYDESAANTLIQILFRHLVGCSDHYGELLFCGSPPSSDKRWSLSQAQGAVEGAEYTEAARGHPCGHIFKNGEATYRCRDCSADDTCVLCTRCFEASDHEGHNVSVSLSPGNSGCCDCGDNEAWIRSFDCQIHSAHLSGQSNAAGKMADRNLLEPELVESIRMTIARAMDYLCDVFSCSPEQLRSAKTQQSVQRDEEASRLDAKVYTAADMEEHGQEYSLVLWNDEKHTVIDVRDQVSRACKISMNAAMDKAHEVDDVGRSIILINNDLPRLLRAAEVIEQPKLTVTIRSARDTFREQMCATIIEWIADIAGCSVGPDPNILRETICKQFLRPWRIGSEAHHAEIGKDGLDDHEVEDEETFRLQGRFPEAAITRAWAGTDDEDEDDESAGTDEEAEIDEMELDEAAEWSASQDMDMDIDTFDEAGPLEESEATLAGYAPPPPPPQPRRRFADVFVEPNHSEPATMPLNVPKTPRATKKLKQLRPARYWLEKPETARYHKEAAESAPGETLWKRVRLDWLILYDLRMWKQLRQGLRHVLISTVVTLPQFKRLLGLRFSCVYTVLAELYLIADREPEHSIINLSLQMLTTPSITAEIVERANFLTNLMAIMYTFLTTRQVGYPADVNLNATLAFEQGAVTNRRTYHFYQDLNHLLGSGMIQERMRRDERYLLQFLDLAKLHQGICPNFRAIGEHVEFENDSFISASIIVQEIIKLCKLVGKCFQVNSELDAEHLKRAIRNTARVTIINSLGAERRRFHSCENRAETRFRLMPVFEFESNSENTLTGLPPQHKVVGFSIRSEAISFHHALHYTLSWLVDCGKEMEPEQLAGLLRFSTQELKHGYLSPKTAIPDTTHTENLLALFDYPLRVMAWLAQMRAGMWVRNGVTLRHQMIAYRAHPRRELSFQRDIFLLQTAMVILPPAQVLASMIDRFELTSWVEGQYDLNTADESQKLDVAEEFVHLLIVLLSDRLHLQPTSGDPNPTVSAAKRYIVHTLCFKPMPFSHLESHIQDKFTDTDQFDQLVKEMTIYRPPEGVTDSGTFNLKDEYYEQIDPYLPYFSRNQRDEAENIYKKRLAKRLGKDPAEIVYVPNLKPIETGLFKDLSAITKTPLFAQVVFYLLHYVLMGKRFSSHVPGTKIEQFLQFVVHLTLVAVLEDDGEARINETGMPHSDQSPVDSFCRLAITKKAKHGFGRGDTIARLLSRFAEEETFQACEPKIRLVLRLLRQKRPADWANWMSDEGLPQERSNNPSPTPDPTEDKERRKKEALERQAKVMAQFKQQQNSFLQKQTIDWGDDDFSDLEEEHASAADEHDKIWNYPSGTCILCQEETNDEKLYGTFALINESRILRQTDVMDQDWVNEVFTTPPSLDRSAEDRRPFGVAGNNKIKVVKTTADGRTIEKERQVLSKGFPMRNFVERGPVATGCGHIMHFSCFAVYVEATQRRQAAAIARNHPENLEQKEFLCPLCKALGNAFLPIVWKGKHISYPGVLQPEDDFSTFLTRAVGVQISKLEKEPERISSESNVVQARISKFLLDYGREMMVTPLAQRVEDLLKSPTVMATKSGPTPARQLAVANSHNLYFAMAPDEPIPASALLSGLTARAGPSDPAHSFALGPQLAELMKVHQRLKFTMASNKLRTRYASGMVLVPELTHTDTLANTLGFTISAVEIAMRGIASVEGSTLLDKIPSQTLTLLRVLSETISSYIVVGGLRNYGENATCAEFVHTQERQLRQLFAGHPDVCSLEELQVPSIFREKRASAVVLHKPMLAEDPFIFLSEAVVALQPVMHLDVQHLVRLCLLAEVTRVVIAYVHDGRLPSVTVPPVHPLEVPAPGLIEAFVEPIYRLITKSRNAQLCYGDDFMPRIYKLARTYALAFTRKCVILMNVKFGVEFPAGVTAAPAGSEEPELDRLLQTLRLPPFGQIIRDSPSDIVHGWVSHWLAHNTASGLEQIELAHPAIFELVGLPSTFDVLQDEAVRRRCPTTGKQMTDPAVCLFCGTILCSQAVCCSSAYDKGGCFQHRENCGGTVGLFINIRKGQVLQLNGENGSWAHAPYLDKHGETDPALRRHNLLFLHQKRYDKVLREIWLTHGIPSVIARRLEGENNTGGWETL